MNICFFGLFLITLNQTRVPGFPPSILTIFTNFHCGQSETWTVVQLRTGYKTRTTYKMRTTDYVGKNCANWF